MKYMQTVAVVAALIFAGSPISAFAQVYYYAPGTVSGAYNYNSYIPAAAMPYVNMGYQMQMQQQQQYQSYSYPSQYQYQSQSQYQSSPSYSYGYMSSPTYGYSYGYNSMPGYYSSEPQSVSYPSGTYGPLGTQMCYWSDYPTYAPCGRDPQQWIQDPYTGQWY